MNSKRLLEITKFVKNNSIVADIGTDHGYIPVYLIEQSISKKVIGSDISKGSLQKIIDYVDQRGLGDRIDTRLGNGLDVIKHFEVDTLIIAGMGGLLIRDILDKEWSKSKSINHFILQPMIGAKELRDYLQNNGYRIVENRLIKEDNKYYEIIYAQVGKQPLWEDRDLEIPREYIDRKDPLLGEFVQHKIEYNEKILRAMDGKSSDKLEDRIRELNQELDNYREVLEEIEA